MLNKKGFTLVEIMIVVAIIALLAAIAIPNLLAARRTANEAAARSNLHSLVTGAETYMITNNAYPGTVDLLSTMVPAAVNLCNVAAGVQGYIYTCSLSSTAYTIVVTPTQVGTTGNTTFTGTTGGAITPIGPN